MPAILATQKTEIRRIEVQASLEKKFEIPISTNRWYDLSFQ
jgi:hypothetical protein